MAVFFIGYHLGSAVYDLRQVLITSIDRNDQPNGGTVRVHAAIYAISLRHNPELIDWRTTMTYNSIFVYLHRTETRFP